MRPFVFPAFVGILIGLYVAFFASNCNSNLLDEGWRIPDLHDFGRGLVSPQCSVLFNQAIFLRFAALMLEHGFWFISIPTILTCAFAGVKMAARCSRILSRLIDIWQWALLLSGEFALLMGIFQWANSYSEIVARLFVGTGYAIFIFTFFWVYAALPLLLCSFIYLCVALSAGDKKQPETDIPFSKVANPGLTL